MFGGYRIARLRQSIWFPIVRIKSKNFHASSIQLARRKRGSKITKNSGIKSSQINHVQDGKEDDDIDDELVRWFNQINAGKNIKGPHRKEDDEDEDNVLRYVDEDIAEEYKDDSEISEEFMQEMNELFSLDPEDFEKRIMELSQDNPRPEVKKTLEITDKELRHQYEDDEDDEDNEYDEADADYKGHAMRERGYRKDEIERIKERMPKKYMLNAINELSTTNAREKFSKFKEKLALKDKKNQLSDQERRRQQEKRQAKITYRQERVEYEVINYVQELIDVQSDFERTAIVPSVVSASVAPDLRRIVIIWAPIRTNLTNLKAIPETKIKVVEKKLKEKEKWFRRQVTRYLNLKYSPIVTFEREQESTSKSKRQQFEEELRWLDQFV